MSATIYLRRKTAPEVQEGPWTEEEFRARVESHDIQFGDFVWRHGMADWVLAGSLALYLSRRARDTQAGAATPPRLAAPSPDDSARAGARERDLLLRMDRMPVRTSSPGDGYLVVSPLTLMLSLQPSLPGGRSWRKLATEFTALFAARVRYEQAGLLAPHPARQLLGERTWSEAEAGEESMALLATEELKRRAVQVGAEELANFTMRFEFVGEVQGGRLLSPSPILIASALAVLTPEGAAARRAPIAAEAEAPEPKETATAELNARAEELQRRIKENDDLRKSLDERERFLAEAEARVLMMMEEQQVREAEFEQRFENFQMRKGSAALAGA